jgi:hypothetical protein
MKKLLTLRRSSLPAGAVLLLALTVALCTPVPALGQTLAPDLVPAAAQTPDTLDWEGKLEFHAYNAYGPWAVLGTGAYAGFLQEIDSPAEWGQGAAAYGKRLASTAAWAGIHGVLAFGLDSTLHEDPRYYRSRSTGFWRRAGHAVRGTVLTRTDAGGETLSIWRIGSAYGAAFLSNTWYPGRLDTPRQGFSQGSITLGFGLASNLGLEFWPDIKAKLFHRK